MDFGELKTAILSDTHRADLSAEVARFVRLGEGLIARRMQGWELDAVATLTDTDRGSDVTADTYTLPVGMLQLRRVCYEDNPLEPAGPNFVALVRRTCNPYFYCVLGTRLQVRGVPGEGAELTVDYRGRLTALSDDTDTNAVLTSHEALYMHAAKHYLYLHTQDQELAEAELALFDNVCDQLNEEGARKVGNAGAAPVYDFGSGGSY